MELPIHRGFHFGELHYRNFRFHGKNARRDGKTKRSIFINAMRCRSHSYYGNRGSSVYKLYSAMMARITSIRLNIETRWLPAWISIHRRTTTIYGLWQSTFVKKPGIYVHAKERASSYASEPFYTQFISLRNDILILWKINLANPILRVRYSYCKKKKKKEIGISVEYWKLSPGLQVFKSMNFITKDPKVPIATNLSQFFSQS